MTPAGAAGAPGVPAVPAATVLLVREAPAGVETLMLRRSSAVAFGGMWVFPGGKVEPADGAGTDEAGAARRAAAREAEEETGVRVDPAELIPFAHWTPPPTSPRRFSTWFFVAACPAGVAVAVDGAEIHEHRWMRPAAAIAARDAGEIELAPPTWVSLWRLAPAGTVAEVLDEARVAVPERFTTRLVPTAAGPVALWHGDSGYEDGDVVRAGPRHRLWMLPGGWRYERGS